MSTIGSVIETFNGVDIFVESDQPTYYFIYRDVRHGGLTSLVAAHNLIISLQAEAPPETFVDLFQIPASEASSPYEIYHGVPVYRIIGGYPGGTGVAMYYFYYRGTRYSLMTSLTTLHTVIDGLIAGIGVPVEPGQVPPTPTPGGETTVVKVPSGSEWWASPIDWILSRLKEFIDGLGSALTNSWNGLADAIKANNEMQKEGLNRIDDALQQTAESPNILVDGLFNALKGVSDGLTKPLTDFGSGAINEATTAMSEHSPDPEIKAAVDEMVKKITAEQERLIEEITHSPADPNQAPDTSTVLAAKLIGVSVSVGVAGALIDILHPIKGIGALEIAKGVIESIGIPDVTKAIMSAPARVGLIPPLEKYYNSIYQPNIPDHGTLVNMRTKEKITQEDFETNLAYQGYSKEWATKIWDAHFNAPTLSDILTAWRRGLIDESRVDELMTLIDLDPFYKQIFDTRKYVTPSISITRFMFETGAINADQVRANVRQEGYAPEYVDSITNFIVNFQARRWRTRYLGSLATGYVKGVRTADQVRQATLQAGYTEDVANWLIQSSDVRKDIEAAKGGGAGTKLLNEGDLKRLYAKNHISADQLRTELLTRGYSLGDVQLLITMLDEEKIVVSAGGTKVALSVPELLNAMRYGLMTEDAVSTELQLRGLSLQEVQILIATKKAQWGMGAE